jgi:Putative prokaryotic signal transducing protein
MDTKDVRLATYSTWAEASMCAGRLESEGIPTVLVPLGAGAGGWGSSSFVPHELRVRAEDLERAKALLGEDAI